MKVLYLIFLLVVFPNVSLSASFDCSKANTNIEHMICDSEELSEFDDQLGLTYEYAKENQNKDAIKHLREWLKNTRNNCDTDICLKSAYQEFLPVFAEESKSEASVKEIETTEVVGKEIKESSIEAALSSQSTQTTQNIHEPIKDDSSSDILTVGTTASQEKVANAQKKQVTTKTRNESLSWSHLLGSAVIFFVISWLLSKSVVTRKLAFLEAPIILLILSSGLNPVVIGVGGGILLFVLSSGSHAHTTKNGKADRRYKDNPYTNTFSEEFRMFAFSGLMGVGVLFLISLFM